ncbi:hypothetical protein BBP40_011463 [Aspergillus hancockii]|nr:hypothetical protein BBP40_011463 [Aspergillus hancockii]
MNAQALMQQGLRKYDIFQMIISIGPMAILHLKYTNEIHKDKRLNFMAVFAKEMIPDYPGFDLFREGADGSTLIQDAVKFGSTRCLSKPTPFMSEEAGTLLKKAWGDDPCKLPIVPFSGQSVYGHGRLVINKPAN